VKKTREKPAVGTMTGAQIHTLNNGQAVDLYVALQYIGGYELVDSLAAVSFAGIRTRLESAAKPLREELEKRSKRRREAVRLAVNAHGKPNPEGVKALTRGSPEHDALERELEEIDAEIKAMREEGFIQVSGTIKLSKLRFYERHPETRVLETKDIPLSMDLVTALGALLVVDVATGEE
jgi:hypothetical protein